MNAFRLSEAEDLLRGPHHNPAAPSWDDLSRNVYCLLGVPIDAIDMSALMRVVDHAAACKIRLFISTTNLNFLINSRSDAAFRESLLTSEICPADGMPIVWIARLLGIPLKQRVAGSDLLELLRIKHSRGQPLRLFLFGGADGVGEAARNALNTGGGGLSCVGCCNPGFGSVEQMSHDALLEEINSRNADFLVAALGAKKGQAWLLQNYDRLKVPVRAHLGATINFAAGKVRRAPHAIRRLGLEWLWRIKEEPHLWKRYAQDGAKFLGLLCGPIALLLVLERCARIYERLHPDFAVTQIEDQQSVTLCLHGAATRRAVASVISSFHATIVANKAIRINLAKVSIVDSRFLGLLLMLKKQAKGQKRDLAFIGVSSRMRAMLGLHGVGYLLRTN